MHIQTLKRFANRPAQRLRLPRNSDPSKLRSLPFIKGRTGRVNFWAVPATGGYSGGWETGEAIAGQLLHYLAHKQDPTFNGGLSSIIDGLYKQLQSVGGEEMEARPYDERTDAFITVRAQKYGFFWALEGILTAFARSHPRHESMDELVERANLGLGFDEPKFMAYLTALDIVQGTVE